MVTMPRSGPYRVCVTSPGPGFSAFGFAVVSRQNPSEPSPVNPSAACRRIPRRRGNGPGVSDTFHMSAAAPFEEEPGDGAAEGSAFGGGLAGRGAAHARRGHRRDHPSGQERLGRAPGTGLPASPGDCCASGRGGPAQHPPSLGLAAGLDPVCSPLCELRIEDPEDERTLAPAREQSRIAPHSSTRHCGGRPGRCNGSDREARGALRSGYPAVRAWRRLLR